MPRRHSLYVYLQWLNFVRRCFFVHANFFLCVLDVLLIGLNVETSVFENESALVEHSSLQSPLIWNSSKQISEKARIYSPKGQA